MTQLTPLVVGPATLIEKTITKESLLAAERKDLCRVMESLSVREHHSRTLLIHYHWDIEKLFAVLECKGKACLLEEAGIPVLDSQDLGLSLSLSMMACGICTLNIPASLTTKIDCGHCFCNSSRNLVHERRPDLADKFDRFLLESYIDENKWLIGVQVYLIVAMQSVSREMSCVKYNAHVANNSVLVAYLKHIHHVLTPCGRTGKKTGMA
ncbi:probable E3 ubiquitin-protein ligase ARI2 [Tanacetum coccineum]